MPVRRSRKGKQGSAAKHAALTAANAAVQSSQPQAVMMESTTTVSRRPQDTSVSTHHQQQLFSNSVNTSTNIDDDDDDDNNKHHNLILTSDKRRGVYECDYCGCDVSQTPRIRCAICVDFDVCCDCFITTDPMTAIARLQTAQHAMALQQQQQEHHPADWDGGGFDASSSSSTGVASTPQHDPVTHGYRVCDSTRYPLFPINAAVLASTTSTNSQTGSGIWNKNTNKSSTTNTTTVSSSSRKKQLKTIGSGTVDDDEKSLEHISEDNKMEDVEMYEKSDNPETTASTDTEVEDHNTTDTAAATIEPIVMTAGDDNKTIWTIEEDLRLLYGIQTHGLGNWTEIRDRKSVV